jgi:hypothetical protein
MLLPPEKPESQAFFFLRSWSVGLLLLMVFGSSLNVVARSPKRSRQEIGINERRQAEQRLWDLGYWAGPIDGKFDSASRQALIAFQKTEGRERTENLTSSELSALLSASRPRPRFEGFGHIEIDLTRQVLFVIDENGTIIRVLPVSTGNDERYVDHGQIHRAHTPRGTFTVLRKINGWRLSSLGLLYYPSYILNGFAVHGSLSVPAYPASHGCIRVPMYAAKGLSRLMPIGIQVSIYS